MLFQILQLIEATALTESSSFLFVFKLIETSRQSPNLSQVGALSFSLIYPFILLFQLSRFSSFIVSVLQ